MAAALGAVGFALLFLSDIFALRGIAARDPISALSNVFSASALLVLAVAADPVQSFRERPALSLLLAALLALFSVLILKALFFSFSSSGGALLCDTGLYALCRHPAAPLYSGLCLCLASFSAGAGVLAAALFFILLEFAAVAFEDIAVFPKTINGYDDYRRRTPFLIPTSESIRACFGKKKR